MTNTDVVVGTGKKPRAKKELAPVALSDTQALIEAITKASRDPTVNLQTMQFLLNTRRALLDEEAEQEWRDAMALTQAELEPVARDLENPQTRSRYSSLAALDAAIRPAYTKHGFAVTYDTAHSDEPLTIMVICDIMRGRHSRRYQIPMPCDGKGARGNDVMSKTHATGSAVSYGRRYLLCMGFNLVTADDDGNRASGYRPPPLSGAKKISEEAIARAREAALVPPASASLAQEQLEASQAIITKKQLAELFQLMGEAGEPEQKERVLKEHFNVPTLDMLTVTEFQVACNQLKTHIAGGKKNGH